MPACNETKDGDVEVMHPLDISPVYDQKAPPLEPCTKEEPEAPQQRCDMVCVQQNLETGERAAPAPARGCPPDGAASHGWMLKGRLQSLSLTGMTLC